MRCPARCPCWPPAWQGTRMAPWLRTSPPWCLCSPPTSPHHPSPKTLSLSSLKCSTASSQRNIRLLVSFFFFFLFNFFFFVFYYYYFFFFLMCALFLLVHYWSFFLSFWNVLQIVNCLAVIGYFHFHFLMELFVKICLKIKKKKRYFWKLDVAYHFPRRTIHDYFPCHNFLMQYLY